MPWVLNLYVVDLVEGEALKNRWGRMSFVAQQKAR
jgi:hypothetical protein